MNAQERISTCVTIAALTAECQAAALAVVTRRVRWPTNGATMSQEVKLVFDSEIDA